MLSLGVNLKLTLVSYLAIAAAIGGFTPRSLFASNEPGVWYDPSDLTTLYQDAAGTIPVTAVEQPVGLMLDKSKGGIGTNGTKRINLVSFTEQFDNTAWSKTGIAAISSGTIVAPNGTPTAETMTATSGSGPHAVYISSPITVISSTSYKSSFYVKKNTWRYVYLTHSRSVGDYATAVFDLDGAGSTATQTGLGPDSGTIISTNIQDVGNGWFLLSLVASASGTTSFHTIGFAGAATGNLFDSSGNVTYTAAGTESVYIWGADFRLASESNTEPTYQPITASWEATIPGYHASQSTAASRPVLSARYNLLTRTEEFDNAAWSKINVTVSPNTTNTTDPLGGNTADALLETSVTANHYIDRVVPGVSVTSGVSYTRSVCLKYLGRQWAVLDMYDTASRYTYFDIQNGVIGTNADGTTASITPLGNGWYRCSISRTVTASNVYVAIAIATSDGGSISYAGDITKGIYIWGADLRATNDGLNLPSYQRVGAATYGSSTSSGNADYDTTGFPYYLRFDGVDDGMFTASIDFTATDEMTIFAGLRKFSDSAAGIVAELSPNWANSNGTFALTAPDIAAPQYGIAARGNSISYASVSNYTAPITNVLTEQFNISGATINDELFVRVNGVTVPLSGPVGTAGSGNFGNYNLYIGRRSNGTVPFNGRLFSLIVLGRTASATEIATTESWVNGKTKAQFTSTPLDLFALGAQGVWYDPSDFTTLYQDSAGSIPVTAVEQPVGLMLDKSKGLVLGPELVDTANTAAAWVVYGNNTVTNDDGGVKVTFVDHAIGAYLYLRELGGLSSNFVSGKTYKLTAELRVNTGSANFSIFGTSLGNYIDGTAITTSYVARSYVFTYSSGSPYIQFANLSAGESVWIRNISVKELPGNHAFQSTAASRPIVSARYNLLRYTEEFDNAAWTKIASTVESAPDSNAPGAMFAVKSLADSLGLSNRYIGQTVTISASTSYTTVFYLKAGGVSSVLFTTRNDDANRGANFSLTGSGSVVSQTNAVASILSIGGGVYRCQVSWTSGIDTSVLYSIGTGVNVFGDGAVMFYVSAPDFRVTNDGADIPVYQRVGAGITTTTNPAVTGTADYDTNGFPIYLRFDGIDDSFSTASINFTSTEAVSVFAGIRKISDLATSLVTELSINGSTNTGTFSLFAPAGTLANYAFRSVGSSLGAIAVVETTNIYPAPITSIVSGFGKISTDTEIIRVNGSQQNSTTEDQGVGTYGTYPLYIGSRGGISNYFNGRLYSLIVVGKQTNDSEIIPIETWINGKTAAYGIIEILTRDGSMILTRDGSIVIERNT